MCVELKAVFYHNYACAKQMLPAAQLELFSVERIHVSNTVMTTIRQTCTHFYPCEDLVLASSTLNSEPSSRSFLIRTTHTHNLIPAP